MVSSFCITVLCDNVSLCVWLCLQTLSYEPQVLTQALQHLSDVLKSLEPINQFVDAPGSSVLLQELANAQTLPDCSISAHSMPLLHGLSAVHSCVNVFTHICKVGQVCILIQLHVCINLH